MKSEARVVVIGGGVVGAGVTHAFAKASRMAGAEVYRGTWARAV